MHGTDEHAVRGAELRVVLEVELGPCLLDAPDNLPVDCRLLLLLVFLVLVDLARVLPAGTTASICHVAVRAWADAAVVSAAAAV